MLRWRATFALIGEATVMAQSLGCSQAAPEDSPYHAELVCAADLHHAERTRAADIVRLAAA